MPKLVAIINRFPEHELAIHRLCSQDSGFRGICEDYEAAAAAFRNWQKAGPDYVARANEYRDMLGEIEAEIRKELSRYLLRGAPQSQ